MDAVNSLSGISAAAREYTKVSTLTDISSSSSARSEFAKAVHSVVEPDNSKSSDASAKVKAAIEFEAMVLSQFIGEMLKEQAAGAFGEGTESDFYISVFSDAISKQLSEAGGFGIAKLI